MTEKTAEVIELFPEPEETDGKDVVKLDDKYSFTTGSIPAVFIEGLFGAAIVEIWQQVDVFKKGDGQKLKAYSAELARVLSKIAYEEVEQIVFCLKTKQDATMKLEHRLARKMAEEFVDEMKTYEKGLLEAKTSRHRDVIGAVICILRFLESVTIILSDYSDKKQKREQLKLWRI